MNRLTIQVFHFSDLPNDVLVNILLRLSVKRIFVCKGVCKRWNNQISDPEFAKFHFEQAQIYPLFRPSNLPRSLYLVQPEKDDFEFKLDMCDHTFSNSECVCHVKVELDTKFELPLGNVHMIHDDKDSSHNMHDPDSRAERNKYMKLNMNDYKYHTVNSCNGFLCLADPSDNDPLIVCNPITDEFMEVPEATKVEHLGLHESHDFIHGFGFSPATNQYKVIRICECLIEDANGLIRGIVAEVHILGTKLWKSIGSFPTLTCEKIHPVYLNGFLYWFSDLLPVAIMSFDIEKECFESVAEPPLRNSYYNSVGMGVLRGELCMTGIDEESSWTVVGIQVWVMKDCGAEKEWSKVFSVELHSRLVGLGPFVPIKYLNDGALLMFQPSRSRFVYKDPRKLGFSFLSVCRIEPTRLNLRVEVIAHIPSFVSLKHALALSGQNIEVLNVQSRYSEFELQNEGKATSLVLEEQEEGPLSDGDLEFDSEDRDLESDSDSENVVLDS